MLEMRDSSKKIVRMMREAGAREVHFRLASPPILYPDYYGIDLPDRGGLLAATHSLEEMREIIGADSLAYLSIEGLQSAVGSEHRSYCTSCYTGVYPVAFPRDEHAYLQLALKAVD